MKAGGVANRYKHVYVGEWKPTLWNPVIICSWERLDYQWTNPWSPAHIGRRTRPVQNYKRRKLNV